MSTNLNKLGKNLARNTAVMRKLSGTTFAQLEAFTGVSARTLKRIEQAKKEGRTYNPMLKTAVRLAATADVSVDQFIGGKLDFK